MQTDSPLGHPRRLSLLSSGPQSRQLSHRQRIRSKYQKFINERRLSMQAIGPDSSSSYVEDNQQGGMPSIRKIRQHKSKLEEVLRQTVSKYHFVNGEKEKKLQLLHRKKMKYEKVLRIRQEHNKEKMHLSESRALLEKEISEQKYRLKRSVDLDKLTRGQSRIKTMSEKKEMGQSRREEHQKNRYKIFQNRSKYVSYCRELHECISNEEKEFKKRRQHFELEKRRVSTENFCDRLDRELQSAEQMQIRMHKTRSKFIHRMGDLEKSNRLLDQKIKGYEEVLKEGSTLSKSHPQSNIRSKILQKLSTSVSKKNKTESDYYQQQFQ